MGHRGRSREKRKVRGKLLSRFPNDFPKGETLKAFGECNCSIAVQGRGGGGGWKV